MQRWGKVDNIRISEGCGNTCWPMPELGRAVEILVANLEVEKDGQHQN